VSADGAEATEQPLPAHMHLPKTVLQLAWRPRQEGSSAAAELAVAGEDSSLRLYAFKDDFLQSA
jgi:elongator complex protein 2